MQLLWLILGFLGQHPFLVILITLLAIFPLVSASSTQSDFPDITFKIFFKFVKENFSSDVSLAIVLRVLFSLTDNTDLLNLHARQQNPLHKGENHIQLSGWIRALSRSINDQLKHTAKDLLTSTESTRRRTNHDNITLLSSKLDTLSKLLELYPYNSDGNPLGKLLPVSHDNIQPVLVICPISSICEDIHCKPRVLHQNIPPRDIPKVTLIKGVDIYQHVPVLTGQCPKCQSLYSADHERYSNSDQTHSRVYISQARYLKIGQSLWVDHIFSNAVVNGIYSFHASAAAYTSYWNNSFGTLGSHKSIKLSRRHIWQAFIQESTCTIAAANNINLQLDDNLSIDEVTRDAFSVLGENGNIQSAHQHTCAECTHTFKATSDLLPTSTTDPAAVVGVDEDIVVPAI